MNVDILVDRFVERINRRQQASDDDWELPDDVPPSVRLGEPDEYGFCNWAIRPSDAIDWVEPLEQTLSFRFPPSFRSLVTRYIFPPIEIEPFTLLANTPERTAHEFRNWAKNREFWGPLLDAGYIPFGQGRLYESIDPICFDTHEKGVDGEYLVVRFFHEEVGVDEQVRIDKHYNMTFLEVLKRELEREDN